MPKIKVQRMHLKKDMGIRISKYQESIKVECQFSGNKYVENRPFVYGEGSKVVGWNTRGIDDFWIPYISRIYANAQKLDIGKSKIIYVERR